MSWRSSRFGYLALALLAAACADQISPTASPDLASGAPLRLDPAVQQAVVSQLKDYRPRSSIAALSITREIHNVGNFGKLVYYKSRVAYARQDNGLIATVGSGGAAEGGSSGSGRSLTLCGLVTLLSTSASTNDSNATSAVPVPKLFVPFGLASQVDIGMRIRVTEFEADTDHICTPAPGSTFSYRAEREVSVKTTGLFVHTTIGAGSVEIFCQVGDAPRAASDFGSGLRGDALTVSCDHVTTTGSKRTSEYIYLDEAGLYLQVSEGEPGDAQTTKVRYDGVEYEP